MFEKELQKLTKDNLLRRIIARSSPQKPVIRIRGRRLLNFSSNDYLGLASHPEIIRAALSATAKYAFGAGASRLLAGGCILHEKLEREIAAFKQTDAALIFNSGYAANTGIIPAMTSGDCTIFSDELNHASIIDGCRLSRAGTVIYRHKDIAHLKTLMKKDSSKRKIIITDTVFSMDGDIAPLQELYRLCQEFESLAPGSVLLYLDDAHGTGVLGKGKGALSHFSLSPQPWLLQMGTFSKALGSFGAFAAGSHDIITWIANTARSFIFSTALPPCIIAASQTAIKLLKKDRALVDRLWANRARLTEGLRELGVDISGSETPIIPVLTGSIKNAVRLSEDLFQRGIYAPAIRPPSVKEPRVRLTISAAHEEKHITRLLKALRDCRDAFAAGKKRKIKQPG